MAEARQVAVVAGVGAGNGIALGRRFAEGGYAVALLARDQGGVDGYAASLPNARGYACDVADLEVETRPFGETW